MNYNG